MLAATSYGAVATGVDLSADNVTAATRRAARPTSSHGQTSGWGTPSPFRCPATTIACVADARPVEHYVSLLEHAHLRVTRVEPHDDALRRMIDRIEARLTVATMIGTDWGFDPAAAQVMIHAARTAVDAWVLGYVLITATAD